MTGLSIAEAVVELNTLAASNRDLYVHAEGGAPGSEPNYPIASCTIGDRAWLAKQMDIFAEAMYPTPVIRLTATEHSTKL